MCDDDPASPPLLEHRDHLWGLCYRITGDAAEADDLVQETFRRFLEHPPADQSRPLRPWLSTVASRLAIDALRRRKRGSYLGSWLPTPLLGDEPSSSFLSGEPQPGSDAEVRYDLIESISMAFLVALEALTPVQRAVLVLRDVLGYSAPEVAEQLQRSPENVRVILHRARKALEPYARQRRRPSDHLSDQTRQALTQMVGALLQGDPEQLRACLHPDAVAVSDGGGRVKAATRPVRGGDNVTRLLLGLAKKQPNVDIRPCVVNGLPALLAHVDDPDPRVATRVLIQADVDVQGRISVLRLLNNPDKLPQP